MAARAFHVEHGPGRVHILWQMADNRGVMILPADGSIGPSLLEGLRRSGGLAAPDKGGSARAPEPPPPAGDELKLSPEASAQVAKLKARDAAVRAHEEAHIAAGGGVVRGGASFTYQNGPDGLSYAVGGEVSVDTAPVQGNPSATIAKADAIRAAALAPADPSPQDLSVASQAALMAADAAFAMASSASTNGAVAPKAGKAPVVMAGIQSDRTPGAYLNFTA